MGPTTIGFGLFLMLVGFVCYFLTLSDEMGRNITALIPAMFGFALASMGVLAQRDIARNHVMHAAAATGLIGMVLPAVRVAMVLASGEIKSQIAFIELIVMAVACGAFVALCIKSFIDA